MVFVPRNIYVNAMKVMRPRFVSTNYVCLIKMVIYAVNMEFANLANVYANLVGLAQLVHCMSARL